MNPRARTPLAVALSVALAVAGGALLNHHPAATGREAVVAAAVGELGKSDPRPYVDDALGYHEPGHVEWCGLFVLWSMHQAGLAKTVHWRSGLGFLYLLPRLSKGARPEPADVAYFDHPFQHHALVRSVDCPVPSASALPPCTVALVNGNGAGGRVTLSTRPLAAATDYYSIGPWLPGRDP